MTPASLADPRYDEAIADLEQALARRTRATSIPSTVKILETNLDAIDKAIDQSRRALAADPGQRRISTTTSRTRGSASSRCSAARRALVSRKADDAEVADSS